MAIKMSLNQTDEFIFGWLINVIKDLCCYYEQLATKSETVADVVFVSLQFMLDKPLQRGKSHLIYKVYIHLIDLIYFLMEQN